MPRGPMAKHPSARSRRNGAASTSREIVLRQPGEELLPVPELPARYMQVKDDQGQLVRVEQEWHEQTVKAWAEMWQFPLVYQAPQIDHHLLHVYIALVDDFWLKLEAGRAVTEQANQIRAFSEQWGVGEKSRRHLQITIQDAEEAMERGRRQGRIQVESEQGAVIEGSATEYLPEWTEDDEDDGSIIAAEDDAVAEAEVVAE
jgi:hypothetical protein